MSFLLFFSLLKSFHLIAMVCWFAGLFYLPRLFVYHALALQESPKAESNLEHFQTMERKLYRGIMTPAMLATVGLGLWMIFQNPSHLQQLWMQIKLVLVSGLVIYHFVCGRMIQQFLHQQQKHQHVYFRWFNEIPVLFLIAIILLAALKPF